MDDPVQHFLPAYTAERPASPPAYDLSLQRTHEEPGLEHYVYSSSGFDLDLGPRLWGTDFPSYGKNDPIQGSFTLRSFPRRLTRVTIKLQARLTLLLVERGLPAGHTDRDLFSNELVLHDSTTSTQLSEGQPVSFSFLMPESIDIRGVTSLPPPSATFHHLGLTGEVKYHIVVDMRKKGIGRHERLEKEILYLPKSRCSKVFPMSWGLTPSDAKREDVDMTNWLVFPLAPKLPKGVPEHQTPLTAELRLPSCSASGTPPISFYFNIALNPSSPTSLSLLPPTSSISISLIRKVILIIQNQKSVLETVVGTTEIFYSRVCPGQRALEIGGKVGWGTEGTELSWTLGHVVQVAHFVRVQVQPPEGAKGMPSFTHGQRVWLHTDEWADDAPAREGPALRLQRR